MGKRILQPAFCRYLKFIGRMWSITWLRGNTGQGPPPLLIRPWSEDTYTRMWEANKQLCPHAHPTQMLMDFEKAAANVFSIFWPYTNIKGCFFHLTHKLSRKFKQKNYRMKISKTSTAIY